MSRSIAVRYRPLAALALSLSLALSGSGCSEDTDGSDPTTAPEPSVSQSSEPETDATTSSSPSPSDAPADDAIKITFAGDTVTPNGDRVEVSAGEEITLSITADAPGALHVHATPEQVLAYEPGRSDLSLTLDQPGVVEVESHELGVIVVQLEVR